jgi:hypothetical protein
MKAVRVALAVASLCLLTPAWAEISTVRPAQKLNPPDGRYPQFGEDVAIDGGFVIVLAHNSTGQAAYFYRRDLATGTFGYKYTLLELATGPDATGEVAMKNGIAAIRMGNEIRIYEHSGANYVHTHSAAPLTHPGSIAISGNSVLVGGDGCTDDAVVYQKGADGNWGITGRIAPHQSACHPEGLQVDLNYDYALVSARGDDHATAWHRDSSGNWAQAGTLTLPAGAVASDLPFSLEKSTAVSPGNYVFERSGNTWTQTSRFTPANFDNTRHTGAYQVVDRDGVLLTIEPYDYGTPDYAEPLVYQETAPGHFEQVAELFVQLTQRIDVSARTVVASTGVAVQVFYLPTPLTAPAPIVNDFETQDVSDLDFDGGQFALARRGSNEVLAQTSNSGMAVAVEQDSDWSGYQAVSTLVTPEYTNADGWVGVVLRYVDANNFYYATVRKDQQSYSVYKRVDGVDTLLLTQMENSKVPTFAFGMRIDGNGNMRVILDNSDLPGPTDKTFSHGRAGVATFQTRADFDELSLSGTEGTYVYLDNAFNAQSHVIPGRSMTKVGGTWANQYARGDYTGISQQNPRGDALAHIGVPIENQAMYVYLRVDSFNSSTTGGWIGLLARYQDPKNYYYAAIRSNNQVQIRKVVNGVVTVLAAAPLAVVPGRAYALGLSVVRDEIRLTVDGVELRADDDSFSSGQYGIGTHSATATFNTVFVSEP